MTLASEEQVMEWCVENDVDFLIPYPDPPYGWVWEQIGVEFALCPVYQLDDQNKAITKLDVSVRHLV